MEYFLVRYDSRVVIYDRRGFIRLATAVTKVHHCVNEIPKIETVHEGQYPNLVGYWEDAFISRQLSLSDSLEIFL